MYVFGIYLHADFDLSRSIGSLVIALEPKAKDNICTAAMLF
jgi:hypothetical protein